MAHENDRLADIAWDEDGTPRSTRFDDVYFSREGGLAEAREVYLAGCGLPDAWRGHRRFTVAELGFGSGLNILALLDLWRRTREDGARLNIFSVEAWPPARQDAARALAAWPDLADLAETLLAAWPTAAGFHRIDFPTCDAVLDLAVGEAGDALGAWDGLADAWFLDGFSPSKNPEMWREDVLAAVAAHSAPGARLATFTVAGSVRRGLQALGFDVAKRSGFGAKGQRLEAVWPGVAPTEAPPPRVAVIGAGIAGAALARAFGQEGIAVTLIEADAPGAGASGNPAALVTPRFDAGGGRPAQLHAQAFARAGSLYEGLPETVIARGAVQMHIQPRDAARLARVAAGPLFEPGELIPLQSDDAAKHLGESTAAGALWVDRALVVETSAVLATWLDGCSRVRAQAASIGRAGQAWRVLNAAGEIICDADVVCLAGGAGLLALAPNLPLQPVRGQAAFAAWPERPVAAAWGGYVIPTREGLLFGATHDRDQDTVEIRPEDTERNLRTLAQGRPELAAALADHPLAARAGVRTSAPDYAPVAGALEPGLFVLGGLGGRGFCLAPLLAEHIAAQALGAPSPLPRHLSAHVGPDRFQARFRNGART